MGVDPIENLRSKPEQTCIDVSTKEMSKLPHAKHLALLDQCLSKVQLMLTWQKNPNEIRLKDASLGFDLCFAPFHSPFLYFIFILTNFKTF